MEFHDLLKEPEHTNLSDLIVQSKKLFADTLAGNGKAVAEAIRKIRETNYAPTHYNVRIQPLDLYTIAVIKAISLFQFVEDQLIILPFNAFVIFAEGAVVFYHDSAPFACNSRILMS